MNGQEVGDIGGRERVAGSDRLGYVDGLSGAKGSVGSCGNRGHTPRPCRLTAPVHPFLVHVLHTYTHAHTCTHVCAFSVPIWELRMTGGVVWESPPRPGVGHEGPPTTPTNLVRSEARCGPLLGPRPLRDGAHLGSPSRPSRVLSLTTDPVPSRPTPLRLRPFGSSGPVETPGSPESEPLDGPRPLSHPRWVGTGRVARSWTRDSGGVRDPGGMRGLGVPGRQPGVGIPTAHRREGPTGGGDPTSRSEKG